MADPRHDEARQPTDEELARDLGKTKPHWDAILRFLGLMHPDLTVEWKHYRGEHGWQIKVSQEKRAVMYLIPHEGTFTASLAFNDQALAALRASQASPRLVRELESAKVFPEGRPARVEVTNAKQVELVKRLVAIKVEA